jgi:hypothetical protein
MFSLAFHRVTKAAIIAEKYFIIRLSGLFILPLQYYYILYPFHKLQRDVMILLIQVIHEKSTLKEIRLHPMLMHILWYL